MVKTSTKAAIAVAMYAVSTLTGFAEDVKKYFEDNGKTYLLSQGDVVAQDREPEQGGPIYERGDIITREDNAELIYRQDDNGNWFRDEDNNGIKNNHERYMSNDFKTRADRAKNLEKLMTFEAASERPGYEGKVFEYDFWSDGTVSRKDEPSVTFYPKWEYNDNVKITSMSDTFNREANSRIIDDVIGNSIDKYNASQEENRGLQEKYNELEKTVDKDNKYPLTSLVLGANVNDTSLGAMLGFRYNVNEEFSVGTGMNFAVTPKYEAFRSTTPASAKGIYSLITKDESGASIGPYAELKIGPVVLRAISNYNINKETSTVQGMQNGTDLGKPVSSTESKKYFSGAGEAAIAIKVSDSTLIEPFVGWDYSRGLYGGVVASIKPTKKKGVDPVIPHRSQSR